MGPEFIDSFIQRCMVASALSRTSTTGTRRSGCDKEVASFLGTRRSGHDKEDAAINSGH